MKARQPRSSPDEVVSRAGGRTAHGSQFFDVHDGRFHNGLLVVAFELAETETNGGGLCCVPCAPSLPLPLFLSACTPLTDGSCVLRRASHKKNFDPPFVRKLADGPQSPLIQGVKAEAGDAIM